jgi:hypothetical protein
VRQFESFPRSPLGKSQIPSTKSQANPNFQISNGELAPLLSSFSSFDDFDSSLGFGAWDLGFAASAAYLGFLFISVR